MREVSYQGSYPVVLASAEVGEQPAAGDGVDRSVQDGMRLTTYISSPLQS